MMTAPATPLSVYVPRGECRLSRAATAIAERLSPAPPKPRLLDRVREAIRLRHYSLRTEEAYIAWIRRYILFHNKRHPLEMGGPEVTRFLTSLAVDGKTAGSTQNQALSTLTFSSSALLATRSVFRIAEKGALDMKATSSLARS